jgi:putative colanic acid biosynthesis glycosyltransferase
VKCKIGDENLKILLVNSVCGIGSTGKICVDLYRDLTNLGHECCIAYGRGNKIDDIQTYKIGNNLNTLLHVVENRFFDNHGFASRKATHDFVEFIEEYRPDIIHLHNIHGYYINTEILFEYLKNKSIPVIWTFHDAWPFSGHAAYIDYVGDKQLPQRNMHFSERFSYPKSFRDNSAANWKKKKKIFSDLKNCTIVTPSDWLKNMAQHSFFSEYEIITVNNGIDLSRYEKESENKKINKPTQKNILAVANIWEKRKGLEDIIYFNNQLKDGYKFTIVGKVNKRLPSSITHISRTDSFDVLLDLYREADVFINPTYRDNFPTTNIESLAAGTPVITYDTGGSGEAINDNVGFVVKQGSKKEFIEKIIKVKKNKDVSDSCKLHALNYDKANMVRTYIELYEKSLE